MKQGLAIALASLGIVALSRALTRYLWPVPGGKVTSYFGERVDPITGKPRHHNGIDIAGVPEGSDVLAAEGGVIAYADATAVGGNTVVIYADDGNRLGYAHLDSIGVAVGDVVRRGQVIGTLGDTGRVTGPHLHFTVSRNEIKVDPLLYF